MLTSNVHKYSYTRQGKSTCSQYFKWDLAIILYAFKMPILILYAETLFVFSKHNIYAETFCLKYSWPDQLSAKSALIRSSLAGYI